MKHRLDSADTIDLAIHWLTKLQHEGWALQSLDHRIEYAAPGKHGRNLPYEAVLTVRLVPSKE